MKTAIVCVSVSHGNTRRIADAIAEELEASVLTPAQAGSTDLAGYDLVGFGSGIFGERFHPDLRCFVNGLEAVGGPAAFVFATSGMAELPLWPYSRPLKRMLAAKGFEVLGSFTCRGWDTWLPLRIIGGIQKGHPDARDLERARRFAREMRQAVERHGAGSTPKIDKAES